MVEPQPTEMEYRNLGPSGLKVSALSYGNWLPGGDRKAAEEATFNCVKRCWEHGINFFDTAEVYGPPFGDAEVILGNAIKALNAPREKLVISTKLIKGGDTVNERGLSRKHIIEGTNNSLKRLQLDYVDVIYAHRPDYETPLEETVRAFNWLIENGKALYWGTSEHSAEQIKSIHAICDRLGLVKPIVEQPQYNMFARERFESEYDPIFQAFGLGTTIWSPLAGGILTGKYNNGIPAGTRFGENANAGFSFQKLMGTEEARAQTVTKLNQLTDIAQELGGNLPQLALAWTLTNKNVSTAIFGATKTTQVDDNVQALKVYRKITPEILARIEKILDNKPLPVWGKTWHPFPPK